MWLMRMRKNDTFFIQDKTILLLSPLFCGGDKPTTVLERTKRRLVIEKKFVRVIYTVEAVLQARPRHFFKVQEER